MTVQIIWRCGDGGTTATTSRNSTWNHKSSSVIVDLDNTARNFFMCA